ncbi:hypothetical protein H0B56_12270 [Haloechinothrix sp. YIM 98757]|uniref:Uncharacterized protein n=1 Tax=Haloechinothrix aidingensis TaxID=2752311 RepID=A0A838AAS3_9PSEU|nr:hypothetical protein [Haloechinothrix aidingensis]MBA0126318.1 hypothetical protein [Haloechinothrix aidingensis]
MGSPPRTAGDTVEDIQVAAITGGCILTVIVIAIAAITDASWKLAELIGQVWPW